MTAFLILFSVTLKPLVGFFFHTELYRRCLEETMCSRCTVQGIMYRCFYFLRVNDCFLCLSARVFSPICLVMCVCVCVFLKKSGLSA